MVRKSGLLLFLWVGITFASGDACASGLTVSVDKHKETISLAIKNASPHKVFTLPSPDRLVIDVPATGTRPEVALPSGYKGALIAHARFGQFDPHTWRLVLDLNKPVKVVDEDDDHGHISVTITAATEEQTSAPVREPSAPEKHHAHRDSDDERDDTSDEWPDSSKKGKAATDYSGKIEKQHNESKAAHNSSHGKPVIVIDPGHGGIDPGTEGPDGTYEKDVVLAYARELRSKLEKSGHYKVLLTRDTDDIIPLRQRVAIARKDNASIFISLHADSAPDDDVRGLSVYTVSEKASDQETEALAARENKADVLTGVNLSDERQDVADILISLAERETKNHSATLADLLVTTLDGKVHLLSNSHRFAGFAVLKAPDVPSVLIEIGFLSHPKEEKLINSKAYRDKVTSGIASGVDEYFRVEKRMGDQ